MIELLHDLENFAKANTKGQLQDILPNFFSMVYKFMNRNYGRHPLLFGSLKKFLGENQYHMKKRVNEEIFGWINELKPTLDVSALENVTRSQVPIFIRNISAALQQASITILRGIDEVKKPYATMPYIADPIHFFKDIPNKVSGYFRKHKQKLKVFFLELEGDIRSSLHRIDLMMRNLSSLAGGYHGLVFKNIKQFGMKIRDSTNELMKLIDKKTGDCLKKIQQGKTLEEQLQLLSKLFNEHKNDIKLHQTEFLKELRANITTYFNGRDFVKSIGNEISNGLENDIDMKNIRTLSSILQKDMHNITKQIVAPQLQVLLTTIDTFICEVKTNLSYIYDNFLKDNVFYNEDYGRITIPSENAFQEALEAFANVKRGYEMSVSIN